MLHQRHNEEAEEYL